MLCLGIESTAHTFGVGVVSDKGDIICNEKITFSGEVGMDLRKLSDFLVANFDSVLKKVIEKLEDKNILLEDIDLVSFSRGPGLGNSLKIGALVAKTLALLLNKPIVGVNHIKAHLEIGKLLTGFKDPLFLYVSGVNTQIIAKDKERYKIYGETEDIGLGNLIDSVGRLLGLPFPAGPEIEKRALRGKNFIELPYTVKGMNVSLGGIYSNIKDKVELFNGVFEGIKYSNRDEFVDDLCYSLQENVFAMVIEVAERAIAYTGKKEFTIVGGVAANKRLREMAIKMGGARGIKVEFFPLEYCMDNGVMIAWQGIVDRNRAQLSIEDLKPLPYITVESEI